MQTPLTPSDYVCSYQVEEILDHDWKDVCPSLPIGCWYSTETKVLLSLGRVKVRDQVVGL